MSINFDEYEKMLADRPVKFTPEDVDYRDAEFIQYRCERCSHYFERVRDRFGVCEIVRLKTDDPIDPDYVCDYFNTDGESYPFRKGR
jgi:hypothetical protein